MSAERILVVEDEGIIAQEIKQSLSVMGFEVVGSAVTGRDAIALAGSERPDLILMDVMLKGEMDGIEAARQIQDSRDIPVIYLTAYADDGIMERAKLTSPYGYIIKPYDERELRIAIEMACVKHEMQRREREAMKRYKWLLDASGAIPWEMDAAGLHFTYIGPQLSRVLGYAPSGWSGLDSLLLMLRPDFRDTVRSAFMEAARGAGSAIRIEYAIRASGGREVWLGDTINSILDEDGRLRLRGYMMDITRRRLAEEERERKIAELKDALARINALQGLLPICAWCRKIRDGNGRWKQLEEYIEEHTSAEFTHSICPECKQKMEDA